MDRIGARRAASAAGSSRLALSELAPGVVQSEIRAMTTECDRMGGINLAQGVCDTPVPAPVVLGSRLHTRLCPICQRFGQIESPLFSQRKVPIRILRAQRLED